MAAGELDLRSSLQRLNPKLVSKMAPAPKGLRKGHDIVLLKGGAEYFPALEKALDAAQREILFETYIFEPDSVGERIQDALMRAAERGVRVYLTLDGFGSAHFDPEWQRSLLAAGVQFDFYKPPRWLQFFNIQSWRRLHRKLVVVDSQVAFCGGINIIDDYYDFHLGLLAKPRLDYSVQVRGPLVQDMRSIMLRVTESEFQTAATATSAVVATTAATATSAVVATIGNTATTAVTATAETTAESTAMTAALTAAPSLLGQARAALVLRDNLRYRRRIETLYLRAIARANEEIIIANAYFVPATRLRRAITAAVQRGVRVTLLVQAKYEGFLQYHAGRAVWSKLLREQVQIYLYEASHLHAKVAVIDGRWATVGSSNLDPISLLLAREANIIVSDAGFAETLRQQLLWEMQHGGEKLDPQTYVQPSLVGRAADWLAYAFMYLLIKVTGNRY